MFGVWLQVTDVEAALGHLEATGVPTVIHRRNAATALAHLDPTQANGVNLFLCAGAPSL